MNKILLVVALLGIVLISGCTSGTNTIDTSDTSQESKIVPAYFSDTCRWDTDCLLTHCRDSTDYVCRSSAKTLTSVKCQDLGGLVSEKNYELCGCIDGVCKGK